MAGGMKNGANFEDRNRIRKWAEDGKSALEISQFTLIKPAVVRRWMLAAGYDVPELEEEEPTQSFPPSEREIDTEGLDDDDDEDDED